MERSSTPRAWSASFDQGFESLESRLMPAITATFAADGADVFIGGDGADFVDGQQGYDTVALGDGVDTFRRDPGDGNDTVEGEAGQDVFLLNGSVRTR